MDKQIKSPVVVIGAGLSGLVTAYRLKKAGIAVKILEARDRPGGRINTIMGIDGIPLEMGATWFGNQHQNLKELLKELKLPEFKQSMEGSAIFEASPFSKLQRINLPPQDPSFRIVGGTGKLINALSNFFSAEEISYNEQVEEILINDGQVYIKTNSQTLSTKKTICCIPPALLLNSVKFSPKLPEAFSTEARNTHTWMQESVKASVVYKEPFWKDHKVSLIVSTQGPVIEFYDHSNSTNSKFALCGFLHPDTGNLKRAEREKSVIAQLNRLFGREAEEYTSYEEVVWKNEKFTNAYTEKIFLPHQNNGNSIFQEPLYEGKILIANSETSQVHGGYMEGAVFSGNMVAKKVLMEE